MTFEVDPPQAGPLPALTPPSIFTSLLFQQLSLFRSHSCVVTQLAFALLEIIESSDLLVKEAVTAPS